MDPESCPESASTPPVPDPSGTDSERQREILKRCEEALSAENPLAWARDQLAGDPSILSAVLRLLAQAALPTSWPISLLDESSNQAPGDLVGGYRLIKVIGRGGMGTVWSAERTDRDFHQIVALKLLNVRATPQRLLDQFATERQLLARLNHPYIAVMIDGGHTESGLPFLVMEKIDGDPITVYCDRHRSSIDARLSLLLKVAQALQAAHTRFILHQDIKPGNILINDEGIPKLVDFGISRLQQSVDDSVSDMRLPSGFTADYASPEQLDGSDITVASDIYSFGVLMYNVLAGVPPYNLPPAGSADLSAARRSLHVLPPSLRVRALDEGASGEVAHLRNLRLQKLTGLLAGDLDAIVMKAMHSDPVCRYGSMAQLADDLERWLAGAPVMAMPHTIRYRLATFIRANPRVMFMALLMLLSTGVGVFTTLQQAALAERRFTALHDFAGSVMGDFYTDLSNIPGTTSLRHRLTRDVQHYLDQLAQTTSEDERLAADIAQAYQRIAEVQGVPTNPNLGDSVAALQNLENARRLAGRLDLDVPANRLLFADINQDLAGVHAWQGELEKARQLQSQVIEDYGFLRLTDVGSEHMAVELAFAHVKLGDLLGHPSFPNLGDPQGGEASYRRAAGVLEAFPAKGEDWRLPRAHALVEERLGTMALLLGRLDDALRHFEASGEIRRALAADWPQHQDILRDYGIALEKAGDVLLRRQDFEGAIKQYESSVSTYRDLASRDGNNVNALRTLALGIENLAAARVAAGQVPAAIHGYQEALSVRTRILGSGPENPALELELESTRSALARLESGLTRPGMPGPPPSR